MAIKHTKVATVADDGTSEVGTNEWNDDHTIDNNTITNDMVSSHTTTKITVPTTQLSGTVTNAQLAGSIANTKLATDPLARANHTGSQAQSTITDLTTDLSSKAPIANPTFTGDVTTPSSVLKNQGIAGMAGVTITTPTSNSIGHVVVAPSGTGTRGQITTSNSSDPSTNGELLAIGSDIYTTNEHAIRTQATGSGTVRPLAIYFDTTKVMQITDANGIDINGNNIDNIQNVRHDVSAMSGTQIDFLQDQVQTTSFSATFTLSATNNSAAGRSKTLKMTNTSGSTQTINFPSGWTFVGTKPTDQAAGKVAILTVTCFGTGDANIVAAYAVEE